MNRLCQPERVRVRAMNKIIIGTRGRGVFIGGISATFRLITSDQARRYARLLLAAADEADGGKANGEESTPAGERKEGT
jgi:hypothetical protein